MLACPPGSSLHLRSLVPVTFNGWIYQPVDGWYQEKAATLTVAAQDARSGRR